MVMISPYTSINELRNFELGRELKRVCKVSYNVYYPKSIPLL